MSDSLTLSGALRSATFLLHLSPGPRKGSANAGFVQRRFCLGFETSRPNPKAFCQFLFLPIPDWDPGFPQKNSRLAPPLVWRFLSPPTRRPSSNGSESLRFFLAAKPSIERGADRIDSIRGVDGKFLKVSLTQCAHYGHCPALYAGRLQLSLFLGSPHFLVCLLMGTECSGARCPAGIVRCFLGVWAS